MVVKNLALLDYKEALLIQQAAHEQISAGVMPNTLFFVEHPSVFTAGKRTLNEERPLDGTPVVDIKPWMIEFGPRGDIWQPSWSTELMQGYW